MSEKKTEETETNNKNKDPLKMFFRLKKIGPEEEKKDYIEDALTFKMSTGGD